jgi:hypothetical protein
MGFGLVTGFTGHLQIITTSNYSAIGDSHTQHFTTARRLFGLLYLYQSLAGNGFQHRRSLNFYVHVLTGQRVSHI